MRTRKPFLKCSDVARILDVHRSSVYEWIKNGVHMPSGETVKLQAHRIGGQGVLRIKRRWLREFLEACDPNAGVRRRPDPDMAKRAQRAVAEFRAMKLV